MEEIFHRKIYDRLVEWKREHNGSTALLVEGARRVGKSTVVEEFARNEYADYLLVDFSKVGQDVRDVFASDIGHLDSFFRNLFLLMGKSIPARDGLIIFDEVQLFPPARQAIKTLVADGRYHYIETGSLISIKKNVQDILIPSEEKRIPMYPMDFEEFLWATGDEVTAPAIREAFSARLPMGDAVHRKVMRKFREYMAVGGMPQAVAAFVSGATFHQVNVVKQGILELYGRDLEKFDKESRGKAAAAFRSIPEQLSHRGSRFHLATVSKSWRGAAARESLDFLEQAMVANPCVSVTEPDVALEMAADREYFKLYMGDTGLLVTQALMNGVDSEGRIYKSLVLDNLGINQGLIVENLVAQVLAASGRGLYYHEFEYVSAADRDKARALDREPKPKPYEIDFLIVRGRRICPVEVKSSGYRAHKSLDCFIEKYADHKIAEKFVLHTKDLRFENGVLYLPLYMAMCL